MRYRENPYRGGGAGALAEPRPSLRSVLRSDIWRADEGAAPPHTPPFEPVTAPGSRLRSPIHPLQVRPRFPEPMRHRFVRSLFPLVAGLLVLGATCGRQGADPVDDDVAQLLQQLEERGEVRVVVALRIPAADSLQATDLDEFRRRIAEAQDEVLEALDPTSYRDPYRFQSVPSMTLTILGEAAYRALEVHSKVEKIGLDVGGVGSGP